MSTPTIIVWTTPISEFVLTAIIPGQLSCDGKSYEKKLGSLAIANLRLNSPSVQIYIL